MTLIIGHRGYRKRGEPDNSIPAFKSAINSKADGLELDIHLTSDRRFVCFHDSTLESLGNPKPISQIKFKDVTSIELIKDIKIPSLEEVLELFGNKNMLNIEFKPEEDGIEELIELVQEYDIKKEPNNMIISSFSYKALKRVKELDPDIPTGLLVTLPRNQVKRAREIGCEAIHPFYETIPDGFTKIPKKIVSLIHSYYINKCFNEAQRFDMLVNPWTVNSEFFLRKAFELS